jgi:hypothetical protein
MVVGEISSQVIADQLFNAASEVFNSMLGAEIKALTGRNTPGLAALSDGVGVLHRAHRQMGRNG